MDFYHWKFILLIFWHVSGPKKCSMVYQGKCQNSLQGKMTFWATAIVVKNLLPSDEKHIGKKDILGGPCSLGNVPLIPENCNYHLGFTLTKGLCLKHQLFLIPVWWPASLSILCTTPPPTQHHSFSTKTNHLGSLTAILVRHTNKTFCLFVFVFSFSRRCHWFVMTQQFTGFSDVNIFLPSASLQN